MGLGAIGLGFRGFSARASTVDSTNPALPAGT